MVSEDALPDVVLETNELLIFDDVCSDDVCSDDVSSDDVSVDEVCSLDEFSREVSIEEILLDDWEEQKVSVDIISEFCEKDWISDELSIAAFTRLIVFELFLNVSGLKIPIIPTVAVHIITITEITIVIIARFELLELKFSKCTFLSLMPLEIHI